MMCTVHPGRSDQIKDGETGGACGTHGRERSNTYRVSVGKLEETAWNI